MTDCDLPRATVDQWNRQGVWRRDRALHEKYRGKVGVEDVEDVACPHPPIALGGYQENMWASLATMTLST